ncbi:MAG TPA: efflux RND transporter periplasmic adaptor subunit [Gemmatimonadaceae bacterium]|jgi:HlyD family secretion protein|nr:efflux RND transporter periplasmic adaptor subunit [Gemmatimonadaceae bacterium]
MRFKRKYLIWTGTVVAVGVFGWLGMRERPIDVDTALVRRGTLQVTVDAEGKTRVRDRYVITAPVAGRLQRMDVGEGARVRAGEVIARISPLPLDPQGVRQAEARLTAAKSLLRDAETRVRQARATLDQEQRASTRIGRLADAGALPERDREEALLAVRLRDDELDAALARARAATADVEQARAALMAVGGAPGGILLIRAPADGCVLRVPERSERVVAPGMTLLELGDAGALELVVDILSADASRVDAGARVVIDRWGDGEALTGRVRLVEPAAFTRVSALGVEEQRVNVIIDLPTGPTPLSDGYRVEARILVREQPNTLMVPVSALFRHGEAWAVFVVDDDRAALTPVRIGERSATDAEVTTGLDAGDRVILFPSDQIETGRRVSPAR